MENTIGVLSVLLAGATGLAVGLLMVADRTDERWVTGEWAVIEQCHEIEITKEETK